MEMTELFTNTLLLTTPIALIAIGELINERAGIINVGVEGTALIGALTAAIVSFYTKSPWMGIAAALGAGAGTGFLHSVWCIKFRANHVVSGIAINIIAMGMAGFIPQALWHSRGTSPHLPTIDINIIMVAMVVIVALCHFFLFKTPWGLRLRMVGEKPDAADVAGINVHRIRYLSTVVNGILCALSGVFLVNYTGIFTSGTVAGRGFIGLAAMVIGNYNPFGAFGGALLFGFVYGLQMSLQHFIPSQLALMLPYLLTVIVLAFFLKKSNVPKALGKPYVKE